MARQKRRLATVDAETDPFSQELVNENRLPEPFLWGYYDDDEYYDFETTEEFVAHISTKFVRAYAHNGGKFDFHYLLPYAEPGSLKVINGRIAEFRIGEAILADSFILLPVPLAAHNKTSIDYGKFERSVRHEHMAEIRSYLRDDCRDLFEFITRFAAEYPLKATLASSALEVWRGKMGGRVDKSNERFYDRIKPYYFGGRCQAFVKGIFHSNAVQDEFRIYDINSAYPHAMLEHHPAGTKYEVTKEVPEDEKAIRRSFLSGSCYSYGALPVRQDDGSVDFPVGRIKFHCTGHEYLAGIRTGTIQDVTIARVLTFGESVSYKNYVQFFYEKKLAAERAGDGTSRLYAKLFMNSLYGKNAANPTKYREWLIDKYGAELHDEWEPGVVFGDNQLFSKLLDPSKYRFYNLATAASITGWVRAYLWEAICQTDEPMYCDTDSIICRGKADLTMGEELGQWASEGVADTVAIAGKKMYAAAKDGKTVKIASKGVRLTFAEIAKVAKGDEVSYTSIVPTYSVTRNSGYTTRLIRMT